MELICLHCGRDRLWYNPYTGNFDCPTCGTPTLPEELTCPLCGKAGSLRTEDGILCCGSCGEVLCDLVRLVVGSPSKLMKSMLASS